MEIKLIHELENYPDGVQYNVKGDLNLSKTTVTKLPNDLYVNGKLDLSDCQQLTELPNNLYVERNLWLYEAPLAKKYTDEQIYEIIASTGGIIIGIIMRYV